jgi:putative ABC transport system permease protein
MNTLLFATAPFPRPESIIALNGQTPEAEFINFSALEIEELRNHSTQAFTAIAPMSGTMETVSLPDQLPEQVQGTAAKADLFKVLETPPLLGRFFTADECVAGRDTVVLLTEEMWRKKFAARPDVLGQTLRISGRIFTIIGVLPKAYSAPFVFGEGQYFRPLVFSKEQQEGRGRREAGPLPPPGPGRGPAASPGQPRARGGALGQGEPADSTPTTTSGFNWPDASAVQRQCGDHFLQLGLAAAILALACANLANLQMARAAARLRDLAIRSALGATRWMLIKQQLIESLVLSVAGGALGLLIADWSNELIGRNIRLGLTSTLEMPIDGRVLGFTAAISILAGLGFGLIPAWLASRTDVNEALKQQARGSTGGKSQGWIRSLLVIGQVALSLTLLSVAGMMIHGLNRTINSRPSWDSESILTANVQIDERTYETPEKRRAFHDALSARLAAIPGIEAHTIASMFPIAGGGLRE